MFDNRFQESSDRIRSNELNFHGLTANADREWKIMVPDSLLADVHVALIHLVRPTEKKHALKPPVRKINDIPVICRLMGQDVAKVIVRDQIRFNPTVIAPEETVRLLQNCRCTALRALMFDQKPNFDPPPLEFFTAFIAVYRIRYIVITARGA